MKTVMRKSRGVATPMIALIGSEYNFIFHLIIFGKRDGLSAVEGDRE